MKTSKASGAPDPNPPQHHFACVMASLYQQILNDNSWEYMYVHIQRKFFFLLEGHLYEERLVFNYFKNNTKRYQEK